MGAFIGYDEIGVWASNSDRNDFLDWFAAHRCQAHDARWEYCKSEANRWIGCDIELDDLIPRGELFVISEAEAAAAASEFLPEVARLLGIISQMTTGEWRHHASSKEARGWRDI
jgi:hypothetical protein